MINREEFIDKTAVANRTIDTFQKMIDKVKQTKMEGVEVYIHLHKKFEPSQRVKVFKNMDRSSNINKEFVGYGYVNSILVEEDYGTIFYQIKKEDKTTKEETEQFYDFSEYGVSVEDYEFCHMILEKAI